MELTPGRARRWIPWLGFVLSIVSSLTLLDNYSSLRLRDRYDTQLLLQYASPGVLLLLGGFTCFCRSPRVLAWTAVAALMANLLLGTPLPPHAIPIAHSMLGLVGYLAHLIGASGLLGATASRDSAGNPPALWLQRFGGIATGALVLHAIGTGISIATTWPRAGLEGWSSPIMLLDSFMVMVSFGLLAWGCFETWRPGVEPAVRARRVFRAAFAWLMSLVPHMALGLYISVFLFQRSFLPALCRILPLALWTMIFAISVALALDRRESRNTPS